MSTVTRWWLVRHAPVVGVTGKIYGSDDVACDVSDKASFDVLARTLPGDAVWLTSHLSRARLTAEAIAEAGLSYPNPIVEEDLGEQSFGHWQGYSWNEMEEKDPDTYFAFWEAPARTAPPGGESFADHIERVSKVVERYTADHPGRDIVAICHGGTIRAAVAHVLGLTPELGMSFSTATLSITRLEHVEGGLLRGKGGAWRVAGVNQLTGMEDDGRIR